jgi:hypothetical protein
MARGAPALAPCTDPGSRSRTRACRRRRPATGSRRDRPWWAAGAEAAGARPRRARRR